MFRAASAAPQLRRLYPFTSHFTLWFSSCTSYPWAVHGGAIRPLHTGGFTVHRRHPFTPAGQAATAGEAVAMAVGLLPPGPAPVIPPARGPAC
ncbi:hypothetical protein ITX44_18110 [Streptomyces sp. KK5PA1]|uniref:Uncharacterized protein n=1 Tax=Actinacidiphila acididurans TaxID=2784346 RepID=A0ABS2TTW6_9ACTN|nr:hypothetical protein [Actinacidiphila acididurans]